MDPETAERLLELNRVFYSERGRDFAETRRRVQAGVRRLIGRLHDDETILDLGCGNGAFALELSRRGHRGRYLGIDQSRPLLDEARSLKYQFRVEFVEADLADLARGQAGATFASRPPGSIMTPPGAEPVSEGKWGLVTALAVLHHLPGTELRLGLLRRIRSWIRADGIFAHSNWQFTTNSRLRARVRPWSTLSARLTVDEGDYLLDWRRGGTALRYVHEFNLEELGALAVATGFAVVETFYSDGADHKSGLYQLWRPV